MLLDRSNFPRGIVIHGLRIRVLKEGGEKRGEKRKTRLFLSVFNHLLQENTQKAKLHEA